jgi:hypothetical protein
MSANRQRDSVEPGPVPVETEVRCRPRLSNHEHVEKGSTDMKTPVILTSLVALLSSPALAAAPKAPAQTVYCVKYEKETGSRLATQECLTKKQWAQKGINIDDLLKK